MAEDGGEKSHDPTPRRREQAKEKGQVAKSQDLAAALVLLCAVVLLMTLGKEICRLFLKYGKEMLGRPVFTVPELSEGGLFDTAVSELHSAILTFLWPMSLFFLLLLVVAVLVNLGQVGFLWLPDKLGFDFSRIDPMKGFGRIFSMQSVMRLLMGIVKIAICAVVAYYAVRNEIGSILNLTANDHEQIVVFLLQILLSIALKVAVALVLIAIIDFMYQKWKFEQDLRMTTEEIREEMKNMLGDPQVRSKRRQIQQEMARQRVQGTETADVVVTNPTHFAVAIRYDPATMDAPTVVAKGADFLAQQIRTLAVEHGIPLYEHKPLAQALFWTVDVGRQVYNPEHQRALAVILGYVYRTSGRDIDAEMRRRQRSA